MKKCINRLRLKVFKAGAIKQIVAAQQHLKKVLRKFFRNEMNWRVYAKNKSSEIRSAVV